MKPKPMPRRWMSPKACAWDTEHTSCMPVSGSGYWLPCVACRVVLLLVSLLALVLEPHKVFKILQVSFLPRDPSTRYSHCRALPGLLVWLYPSGLTWIVASLNIVSLSHSLKAFFISFITVNNSILKCICPHASSLPTFSSLLLLSLGPRLCLLFHSLWTGWFSGRWTGIQSISVCVYQIVSQSSAGTCRVELTKQVVPRASLCEAEPHSELRST